MNHVRAIFPTVDDSPMFRAKVNDLCSQLDHVGDRSAALVNGAKSYRSGLAAMMEGNITFVDQLQKFAEGTDEDSLSIGGGMVSKFIAIFKELTTFHELLHTQVDVLLCERMLEDWQHLANEARDSKRKMEKKGADAEHMRLKHLGHSKARGWRPEVEQEELLEVQAQADEQRFAVARKVAEVDCRKRYVFLEAVVGVMDAHVQYFRRGYELLEGVKDYLQVTIGVVEQRRQEEKMQQEQLEFAIKNYKVARSAREAALVEASYQRQQQAAEQMSGGPLQLRLPAGAMREVVEAHMQDTSRTAGQVVTVLHSGYLLKKSSNIRKEWNRRFFVLDSQGMLYYYSNKEKREGRTQQNSVHLLTATIKPHDEDESLKYCFRVVSPDKTYTLQAGDELDKKEWVEVLTSVISALLCSNNLAAYTRAAPTTTPARPTHTRTPSGTVSLEEYDRVLDTGNTPYAPLEGRTDVRRSPGHVDVAETVLRDGYRAYNGAAGPAVALRADEQELVGRGGSVCRPSTAQGMSEARAAGQGQPSNHSGTSGAPNSSPLSLLRQVPGNTVCAECTASDPDWASLNLGILVCIECSGVHRNLGVHLSKVRSLTLDVAVWQPHVLQLFQLLGNNVANSLWETNLSAVASQGDSWVWCDDSDEEDEERKQLQQLQGSTVQRRTSGKREVHINMRPRPDDRLVIKEQFIAAKYRDRKFVSVNISPGKAPRQLLWQGAMTGDVRTTYAGLVGGADPKEVYNTNVGLQLVNRTQQKLQSSCGASVAERLSSSGTQAKVTALHAAAMVGHLPTVELLCLSGSAVDAKDAYGRTPLMYALIHGQLATAELLYARAADATCTDHSGISAVALLDHLSIRGDIKGRIKEIR